jgi:hypothetical protein
MLLFHLLQCIRSYCINIVVYLQQNSENNSTADKSFAVGHFNSLESRRTEKALEFWLRNLLFIFIDVYFVTNTFLTVDVYETGLDGGWFCTALQGGRSRIRFPIVYLEFFIDIFLPAALWLWGRLPVTEMSTRNICWGVEAAGAKG